MTAPGSSGGSPLRIGGFALIGVGIVAGVIGLATTALGNGAGSDNSAAAPTSATAPAVPGPSDGAGATPTDGSVPVPSFGANSTGNIAAPGSPAPGDGTAGGTGGAAGGTGGAAGAGGGLAEGGLSPDSLKAPVRVYNNSTITGLAARAADDFRGSGWQVEGVANYPQGIIPTSTVYYRPGTSEQQAAETLGKQFGMRVEQRFQGLDDASPGIIVIVTNDYQRR